MDDDAAERGGLEPQEREDRAQEGQEDAGADVVVGDGDVEDKEHDEVARAAAAVWAGAAVWVGILFVMANTAWQASSPPPTPEQTFLGIPASAYYAAALFGGALLMVLLALMPDAWVTRGLRNGRSHGATDRPLRDPA